MLRGIWGNRRGRHCAEFVFTLLGSGHLADPLQAVAYRALTMFQRMVVRQTDLHGLICSAWASMVGQAHVKGPMWIIWQALRQIGGAWVSPFVVAFRGGLELDLRSVSYPEWAHLVREELR